MEDFCEHGKIKQLCPLCEQGKFKAQEERIKFWEKRAKEQKEAANYYRAELTKAHALLGRVIHQQSERWDSVNLTEHFPTDNLDRKRRVGNPTGE